MGFLERVAAENHYNTMDKITSEIEGGKPALKPTETVDKSGPVIEEGVTVKKVDRAPLLNDIAEGAELKKTETVDKSGPAIDPDVKIKESARPALLEEIKKKGDA